jgi:hypothetical protein
VIDFMSISEFHIQEMVKTVERLKVLFFIGKYRDEVYCDVIDINTCDLLFGRL